MLLIMSRIENGTWHIISALKTSFIIFNLNGFFVTMGRATSSPTNSISLIAEK